MKTINTVCEQNAELLNYKAGGMELQRVKHRSPLGEEYTLRNFLPRLTFCLQCWCFTYL
jgi:hypothetical protein